VVVVNALLVMAIAWRIGGRVAGLVAGFAASASAYLNGFGTSLYLDPMQCSFLLLAVLALLHATRDPRLRWFAAAGVCVGLAFLTKESAVQWAPLGVAAWLGVPALRSAAGGRGAVVYTMTFGATILPWFVWVFARTSDLFLIGDPSPGATLLLLAAALLFAMFAGGVSLWPCTPARVRNTAGRCAMPALALVIALWAAFMLYGLTRYSTWPYPNDYLHTIPEYLLGVAPQAQPYFLIVAAWVFAGWRAARGDDAMRVIAVCALLFAPFALFILNRGLELRDALPLVYLSYVALGTSVAWLLRKLGGRTDLAYGVQAAGGGLAIAALALAAHQAVAFHSGSDRDSSEAGAADWDSPFARELAAWMSANLPGGAHVLSSRLYFSSLYVHTDGRYAIRQMPTVRVDVEPSQPRLLTPASNLFRWEDQDVYPASSSDMWLHLRQFPGKDYWIGLRQQELLAYIVAHEIDYVVLTGDDGVFSSAQPAAYFGGHPAFRLLHASGSTPVEQAFVYAVDRNVLFVKEHPTAISPADAEALARESGMSLDAIEAALGTPLRITDGERGLSPREQQAARQGIDVALP
jgi:hypothetical protein